MKDENNIIVYSIGFGILFWLTDSFLDYFFFYKGTFLELLFFDVPGHEVYIRLTVLSLFAISGILISRLFIIRKLAEEKIYKANRLYAVLSRHRLDCSW